MKCCICGREIKGYGNNPYPLVKDEEARCCDDCDMLVIAERIRLIAERARKEAK